MVTAIAALNEIGLDRLRVVARVCHPEVALWLCWRNLSVVSRRL